MHQQKVAFSSGIEVPVIFPMNQLPVRSVSWNACMSFFDWFSSTVLKFDPGAIILPVQLQSCWHNDRGFLSGRCPVYSIAVLCRGPVPAEAAVALVPRSQRKCWTLQLVATNRDFSLLTDRERPETHKSAKMTLQQRGGGGKTRPKHPDRSIWSSAGTWDSSLTQHKQWRSNLTGHQWRLFLCVCVSLTLPLSLVPSTNVLKMSSRICSLVHLKEINFGVWQNYGNGEKEWGEPNYIVF